MSPVYVRVTFMTSEKSEATNGRLRDQVRSEPKEIGIVSIVWLYDHLWPTVISSVQTLQWSRPNLFIPTTSMPSSPFKNTTRLTLDIWNPTKKTKKKHGRKILTRNLPLQNVEQGTRVVSQSRMVAAPAVARVVGLVQWTDLTTAPPWASGKICFCSAVADKMHKAPPGATNKSGHGNGGPTTRSSEKFSGVRNSTCTGLE